MSKRHDDTSPTLSTDQTVRIRVRPPGTAAAPSTAADPMPEGLSIALEAASGPARGTSFQLDRRIMVLGREGGDIRIADPMISRRHASIEVLDVDTVVLRDLSSTNGTYHNGRLIALCRLADADEILIGSTVLIVLLDRIG